MVDWATVALSGVVATATSAGWKYFFDQRLARIGADVARDAERFKQRHALFAEKQTNAVLSLFEALANLQVEMSDLLNPAHLSGGGEKQFAEIQALRFEAHANFRRKRLLLSGPVVDMVEIFINRFSSCEMRYRSRVARGASNPNRDEDELQLYAEVELDLGARLKEIEGECRALLASGLPTP